MKKHRILTLLAFCGTAIISTLHGQTPAQLPSQEEMWRMIQAQQKQIEELTAMVRANQADSVQTRNELASAKAVASNAQTEASSARKELASTQAQLEATTLAVEEAGSNFGTPGWWEKTSIGGYGELHYNGFEDSAFNEIDFHRFVLFVNHEYNDWISLFSEIEIEHADTTQEGAVELEQAFIRLDWTDHFSTDVGLQLVPVGILNETHEPNTFYGVERNRIETTIIPTTWREAGIKANYRFENGLSIDAGILSGLDFADSGSNEFRIRSARQDVSEAPGTEPAYFTRVKYRGIPGLEIAGSLFYQDDLAQDDDTSIVGGESISDDFSGLLASAHIDYNAGGQGFAFRALAAGWEFNGEIPDEAEDQYGYYIEPSYRWHINADWGDIGIYARYSDYTFVRDSITSFDNQIVEAGVNWWPHPNVVFKFDIQDTSEAEEFAERGPESDYKWNLGVGYQF